MFQYGIQRKISLTVVGIEAVNALLCMAPTHNNGEDLDCAPKLGQYLLNNTSSALTPTSSTLSFWPSGDGSIERMANLSSYSPVEIELQEIQESPVRKSIFEAIIRQNGGEHAWTVQNQRFYAIANGTGEIKYFQIQFV